MKNKKNLILIILGVVAFLTIITVFAYNYFAADVREIDVEEEEVVVEEEVDVEEVFLSITENFYDIVEKIFMMEDDSVVFEFEDDITQISAKISELSDLLDENGVSSRETKDRLIQIEERVKELRGDLEDYE